MVKGVTQGALDALFYTTMIVSDMEKIMIEIDLYELLINCRFKLDIFVFVFYTKCLDILSN